MKTKNYIVTALFGERTWLENIRSPSLYVRTVEAKTKDEAKVKAVTEIKIYAEQNRRSTKLIYCLVTPVDDPIDL